jgi:hypothetical protein
MSFVASDRASSASQLSTRVRIRYASRKATAGDHAAWAADGDGEVGLLALNALFRGCATVLGTHSPATPKGPGRPATSSTGRPA